MSNILHHLGAKLGPTVPNSSVLVHSRKITIIWLSAFYADFSQRNNCLYAITLWRISVKRVMPSDTRYVLFITSYLPQLLLTWALECLQVLCWELNHHQVCHRYQRPLAVSNSPNRISGQPPSFTTLLHNQYEMIHEHCTNKRKNLCVIILTNSSKKPFKSRATNTIKE